MTCLDPRDRADLHAELEWLRRLERAVTDYLNAIRNPTGGSAALQFDALCRVWREGGVDR